MHYTVIKIYFIKKLDMLKFLWPDKHWPPIQLPKPKPPSYPTGKPKPPKPDKNKPK